MNTNENTCLLSAWNCNLKRKKKNTKTIFDVEKLFVEIAKENCFSKQKLNQ